MATILDRLNDLIDEQEKAVARAFRDFIRNVNDKHVMAKLLELVEANLIDEALDIIDSFVMTMADVLPRIQETIGTATATELTVLASDYVFTVGFDPSHPRAAAFARANRLQFITAFSEGQREATRQALATAFMEGTGTAGTARAFRASIGLTPAQERWVSSYRNRLLTLDPAALGMDLRNRRWDKMVRRAIENGRALKPAQIERMVEAYRLRALMYRSETIARTEAVRATSAARQESLKQMIEVTNIPAERITRVWNYTRDERTREHHQHMTQNEAGVDEPFVDGLGNAIMWPGDPEAPADTTINCRCAVTFRVAPPPAQ